MLCSVNAYLYTEKLYFIQTVVDIIDELTMLTFDPIISYSRFEVVLAFRAYWFCSTHTSKYTKPLW